MLNLGNNIGSLGTTTVNETQIPQPEVQEQSAMDYVNLFDEIRLISDRRLQYSNLCADLANEDDSVLINYLTRTVQNGIQDLSAFNASQDNSGFLQESISGLSTNFQSAAITAKYRAEEKQESMQAFAQNNNMFINPYQGPGAYYADTSEVLNTAINNVNSGYFANNMNNVYQFPGNGTVPGMNGVNPFENVLTETAAIPEIPVDTPNTTEANIPATVETEAPAAPDIDVTVEEPVEAKVA